jgi:hypothetical protein
MKYKTVDLSLAESFGEGPDAVVHGSAACEQGFVETDRGAT